MKDPSDKTAPFRLDERLYPENTRVLLPWGTPWNNWAEWCFPKIQVIRSISERFVEQFSFVISWRGKHSRSGSPEGCASE